jgi:cytochrome c oxidase cbb3-type subunit 3
MIDNLIQFMRCLVWIGLFAAGLYAQDGGRGGRAGIREFLGLGPPPDAAAAARGEKLYAPNCGFCHGDKARGAAGPNLVRSTFVLHDEKGETLGPVLTKGFVEKGMPAFPQFTPDQIYDLAQFLHLQVDLVANRGTYKRLNVVTGDARAGEVKFLASCASCHSPTGDLAHIGSRYEPDQLQTRFVWPAGRGGARPKVTITLTSGEKITGTLKKIDDFDVSLYDSTGTYRSWRRDQVGVIIEDRLVGHRKLLEQYTDADMHNLTAYLVTLK